MPKDIADRPTTQEVQSKPLAWLLGRVRHTWGWIFLSIASGFFGGILLIVQAWILSDIIHGAFIDGMTRTVFSPHFLILITIIIARSGLAWVKEVTGFQAGAKVRQRIRMALMRHIGALGPVSSGTPHSGALSTVVVEQVEALQSLYALYLPQLALAVCIPAAIVALIFPISWAAGGLLLLTAPLIPFFMILVGMGAESISQRNFQALARMSAHFLDILQGLPTLKLLNRSRGEEQSIENVSNRYRRQTMRVLRVAFLSTAVLELFSSLSIALVAVYLGSIYLGFADFGMYGETLTLKHGLFILLLAPEFFLPLRELGTHFHARAEALGASKEIVKILSLPSAANQGGDNRLQAHDDLHLDCRNVSFGYDPAQCLVLNEINLCLSPGEHVVLVGESGAGKTTLINLLLGFLTPSQGDIFVNNQNVSELEPQSWHSVLAWVGQQPVLFNDSIAGNIAMARPGALRSQIEQAARFARVSEFAHQLPDGLDTKVGEKGWGLSRGQAQRVALARAFLKDAPILLLDEPAAGLDMENEQLVMETIEALAESRSVLLLTHRLRSIQAADRIVVLHEGRFVQQGGYEELISQPGVFREMVDPKVA